LEKKAGGEKACLRDPVPFKIASMKKHLFNFAIALAKTKSSLILAISFLIVSSAAAVEWRSAKEWHRLSYDGKIFYMNGVFDGISAAPSLFESEKEGAQVKHAIGEMFKGMDAAGAVKALDWFYSTPQNQKIPIGAAVMYLAVVGHAELRSEAAQLLSELRRKSR
jgi:hypothetical protein